MTLNRRRIRHPLYPALAAVPAMEASVVCAAIAGTFHELIQAHAAGARATRVVFHTHGFASPFLSDSERDRLWELFEVPAYTLVLDSAGRVAAYECEAHAGLHLAGGSVEAPPISGEIETSPCACGQPGLRFMLTESSVA